MLLTGKAVLPSLILVAAFLVAAYHVRKTGSEERQANLVPMPLIGDVNHFNREGPWPECKGMSQTNCAEMIQGFAKNVEIIVVANQQEKKDRSCQGFEPSRVCIYVDENGIVTKIPHKG